jgi:hypothetical protein
MIGIGVGIGEPSGPARAGRVALRQALIESICTARDEFVRLHQQPPTHIGVPDSYRMDLVGTEVAGMRIVWLDGQAHSAPVAWREAGA